MNTRHVDRDEFSELLTRGIKSNVADIDDTAATMAAGEIALWLYANGFTMVFTKLEFPPR